MKNKAKKIFQLETPRCPIKMSFSTQLNSNNFFTTETSERDLKINKKNDNLKRIKLNLLFI